MSIALALAMMLQSAAPTTEPAKYETVKGYYAEFADDDGFAGDWDLLKLNSMRLVRNCDDATDPATGIVHTCEAVMKRYKERASVHFQDFQPLAESVSYGRDGVRRIVWAYSEADLERLKARLALFWGTRPESLAAAYPSIFCARYGAFVLDPVAGGQFRLTYWNTLNGTFAKQNGGDWQWQVCGQQQPTYREQFQDAVRAAPYVH